ncbi:hypothetical protein LNO89_28320 [Klebsiella pneumoniae subsp. pneumoniae]|nr:hypothetical protein [Klebsiella pneumoniae subsp. pneumoniae]
MSTKLKLLGVDVASFGDAQGRTPGCQSYQWTDGPQQIYKKIVVSQDGKALLGGVLVGDASDYATLLQMMLNGMALPPRPESLILPALEGAAPKALGVAALPDSAPICSCHNVSKGDICQAVNNGAGDMSAIKKLHQSGYRLRRLQRAGETGDGVSAGGAGRRSEKRRLRTFPVVAPGDLPSGTG